MKIIIGTANFNKKYGILKKKFNNTDLSKLSKKIKKENLFIDTAQVYNNNKIIKKLNQKRKIFSKFKINFKKKNNYEFTNLKIRNQLKELNISKFYGLMFHDSKDIFSFKKNEIKKYILSIKKKKIAKFVGVSVYSPSEIKKVLKIFSPDFIQFPLNIFDKRFISNKNLQVLKKKKIKLIARSCFLQGIILKESFPFNNMRDIIIFNQFQYWLKKEKLSALTAAINFIKNKNKVDFLVIGVNNYSQLKEISQIIKSKKKIHVKTFKDMTPQTIDPRKWKK